MNEIQPNIAETLSDTLQVNGNGRASLEIYAQLAREHIQKEFEIAEAGSPPRTNNVEWPQVADVLYAER